MNSFYEDANAECPYYREEGYRQVICEGVDSKSTLQLVLNSKGRKQEFKEQYCCARWKRCHIAQMLNRMYDYEP